MIGTRALDLSVTTRYSSNASPATFRGSFEHLRMRDFERSLFMRLILDSCSLEYFHQEFAKRGHFYLSCRRAHKDFRAKFLGHQPVKMYHLARAHQYGRSSWQQAAPTVSWPSCLPGVTQLPNSWLSEMESRLSSFLSSLLLQSSTINRVSKTSRI